MKPGREASASSNHVASTSPESSPEIQRDEEENVKPKLELTSPVFAVPEVPHGEQLVSSFSAPSLVGPSTNSHSLSSIPEQLSNIPPSNTFQDFRDPSGYARSIASTSYAPSVSAYTGSIDTAPSMVGGPSGMSAGTFAQEAYKVNNELNALFSAEFFDKFFHDYLDDNKSGVSGQGPLGSPDSYSYPYDGGSQFPFATEPVEEVQPFMGSMPPPLDPDFIEELCRPPDYPPQQQWIGALNPMVPPPPAIAPYPSEYQHYSTQFTMQCSVTSINSLYRLVHLFYQMFLHQMPVMHISTFTVDGKPQILLSAMQACGALYVKTAAAGHFIDETLSTSREQLMSEFVSVSLFACS